METQKRNHAHANLHGSARQLAWMDARKSMVGLSEVHGSASGVAWLDSKSPILTSKTTSVSCRTNITQPPRQEVLPPPLRCSGSLLLRRSSAPAEDAIAEAHVLVNLVIDLQERFKTFGGQRRRIVPIAAIAVIAETMTIVCFVFICRQQH